ncbi:MAG: tripartite tricarboxylate transporter substrate binding protein [Desulfobacterales bacterium]|nr:tripartite tricarboxylate transporter substrate binding protein [Desulfobacterales bacterium]
MTGFHLKGKKIWVIALVAVLSVFAIQNVMAADKYPNRPIELVLPVSAGGGFDLTSRVMISVAKDYFGVPMTVTLKPGAGTVTGTKFVASSKPDGYTLMAGGEHAIVLGQFEKIPVDVLRDLIPVCRISSWPWVLVVAGEKSPKPSPFKTAQEFIEFAKKNPGTTMGNSGALTVANLPALQLEIQGGMSFTNVPYAGGGPLRQACLSGEVPAGIGPSVWAAQDHGDKLLRALAVTGEERHPDMPDVPTFRELGYEIDTMLTFGIFAPKGTSEDKLSLIEGNFGKLVKDKSITRLIAKMGERISWLPRKEFAAAMKKTEAAAKEAAKVLNK